MNRHFFENGVGMATQYRTSAKHHRPLGKRKSKSGDITSHPSGWLLLKTTGVGEGAEHRGACTLLLGMPNGAAATKTSVDTSQRAKNRAATWPGLPILGPYPQEPKSGSQRETHSPCLLQHCWQEPRFGNNLHVHQHMTGYRKCGITNNRTLFDLQKEGNCTTRSNVDEPGGHDAEHTKSQKDKGFVIPHWPGGTKGGSQLWVHKTQSSSWCYLLTIVFSTWTTVNLLLPHVYVISKIV